MNCGLWSKPAFYALQGVPFWYEPGFGFMIEKKISDMGWIQYSHPFQSWITVKQIYCPSGYVNGSHLRSKTGFRFQITIKKKSPNNKKKILYSKITNKNLIGKLLLVILFSKLRKTVLISITTALDFLCATFGT